MGKKKADNVVALNRTKYTEQEMEFYAEVLTKDEPSEEARKWFQKELGSTPDEWRKLGDLTTEATEQALKNFWLGYATKEAVMRGAELLKTELGYENASPLERLLIEQAVLCHIRLGIIEHTYSRQLSGSYHLNVGAHWEMRLTLAQRRYMKAITTLARVRLLLARAELAESSAAAKRRSAALSSVRHLNALTG
jgi:hypothetical protein